MNELSPIARPPRQRKPDWIRVKAPTSAGFAETKRLMREKNLATVCEEAACPNIGECWTKKHATVMILGDTCTRACAFCNVKTGMRAGRSPGARACRRSGGADGAGAHRHHLGRSRRPARWRGEAVRQGDRGDPQGGRPATTIEILTPDFRNKAEAAVEAIVAARPDVYNHNLETVPRLYPTIRPGARYYARSGCSRASSGTIRRSSPSRA
ncbi:hypothetical protein L7F22_022522 [Adiantum nelumboides]|nr:hypothetical protein [Adiantum nelumboides]